MRGLHNLTVVAETGSPAPVFRNNSNISYFLEKTVTKRFLGSCLAVMFVLKCHVESACREGVEYKCAACTKKGAHQAKPWFINGISATALIIFIGSSKTPKISFTLATTKEQWD